jgi:hypothetical protein
MRGALFDYTKPIQSQGYGKFIVVKMYEHQRCLVRFLDTGFEIEVSTSAVRKGTVKDRLGPSMYGVGCIGSTDLVGCKDRPPAYSSWILVCYNVANNGYTAEPDWLNYSKFLKWHTAQCGGDYIGNLTVIEGKHYSPLTTKIIKVVSK